MPFIKVPYSQVKDIHRERSYHVEYVRLSRDSDCSLSKTFLNQFDIGDDTIDFEYDTETGHFRFQVGPYFDRPLSGSGTFLLPTTVLRTIWNKQLLADGQHTKGFARRSAYFKPVLKEDGWWYGEFKSFIRPVDTWVK
ncbi:hypothetical protein MOA67_gp049 [Klebsiella phage KpLz-2_45]|uniref:hypothetical protein n=1 Tax=Klebsiella phage KpLz-2_45 TaxID=2698923 RepID=UPI001F144109|nr:hypothetical protein MOA67_gp049 [Klebsiella phage KpLz-2_45]UKS71915.1 hypothetical protein KpLz245_0490 [Klebsiella phage KpLz-2_45]